MANNTPKENLAQTSSHASLTVENVTKLELQYEFVDADTSERRKVEDYIRKTQEFGQQQNNSKLPLQSDQLKNKTGTLEEIYGNGKENVMQTSYSGTKKKSKATTSTNVRESAASVHKNRFKSVQTQTEWNQHNAPYRLGKHETAEPEDLHGAMSTPLSEASSGSPEQDYIDSDSNVPGSKPPDLYSVRSEPTQETRSVEPINAENPGSAQVTLTVEECSFYEASQDLVCCDFCQMPKKPFPSVEQIISEPPGVIFCCIKSQELFQSMIMDTISSYVPEENGGQNNMTQAEAQDKTDIKSEKLEDKNQDEPPPTQPYNSDEIKALIALKEEMKKINTKDYVTSLASYLNMYGSLFATEKITFSLESANERTRLDDPKCHPAHDTDDQFSLIMGGGPTKVPDKPLKEKYHSGSDFSLLFPDGSGQVLYPSGNIGILIACSKPAQFTLIILDDATHKPQIQAIFLSNGHAACYHQSGRLWLLLDPCGGSYFDKSGVRQKQWTWWDLSQHVHAPPLQPITLKLNPSIEIKILTQDQIYLRFTHEKKKITFNVGCSLMVKDPNKSSELKRTGEAGCYLCSKHLQISNLLKSIRDILRSSHTSHITNETAEDYKKQLEKSLNYITRLSSKPSDAADVRKKELKKQLATSVEQKHQPHRTLSPRIGCEAVESTNRTRKPMKC